MTCQDIAQAALTRFANSDAVTQYTSAGATLFCAGTDGDIKPLGNYPDLYEGLTLETAKSDTIPDIRYLGILTTGWAAPLNPDGTPHGAPSEHPERVRCMVISVVDQNLDSASILALENMNGELITDPGEGEGPLADALKRAMAVIRVKYIMQN
jgi:hypothetical protein